MTQSESENVAHVLRKTRERLGLSINDVAVATKINPRVLKALEDGQFDALPAKSFTRGFIRTYAAYLKIEAKPLLDSYESAISGAANKKSAPEENVEPVTSGISSAPLTKQGSSIARPLPSSKIFLVASLLFLVALIIGVKKVVDKYAHERTVENVTVMAPVASPLPSVTPSSEGLAATPQASGTPSAEAEDNDSDSTGDDDAKDATTVAAAPGAGTKTNPSPTPAAVAEKPAPKPKPAPTKSIVAVAPSPAPSAESAPASENQKGKPQEVIVEALDTVDITIQVDNDAAKTVKLTPESVHTIKAKSQIDLEIADGGMVNLIYNGHERGVPGVLGKPVKVKFP